MWIIPLKAQSRQFENHMDDPLQEMLHLLDLMHEAVCVLDANCRIQHANEAMTALLGQSAESIVGVELCVHWIPVAGDDKAPESRALLSRVLEQGETLLRVPALLKVNETEQLPVVLTMTPSHSGGERKAALTLVEAVTTMQASQSRFETVFEDAGIGIVLMELDGTIIRANPAWEELMHVDADTLEGSNFNDTLLPEFRLRNKALFAELVDRYEPRGRYALEIRFGRKNADPVWVNMIVSLIRDEDGAPHRVMAMLEDITERKHTEAELREVKQRLARSRERERLRLAQELHDGTMQDLYAVQFLLQKLNRYIVPEGQQTANIINKTFAQVNETLRAVARKLRPPTLAPFGLEVAIRAHAESFRELYPDIQVQLDLMPDGQLLPEYLRLTLYRIQQEMLNNIAKHAEATRVAIEFSFSESDVMLEIRDNGRGFAVPERWIELARSDHFGLLGSAERAEEIDGTFVVLSSPGQGTTVRVSAPRP